LESASVPGAAPTAPSPASLEPTPAPGLEPPPDTPAAPSLALPEAPDSSAVAGYREIYPRFRMYARNIDAVESLRLNLLEKGYRVSTKAGEIAVVRLLDKGFFVLFWVIFGVAVVGAFLSVVSGSADQVEKSRKSLAYLALLGFGRGRLLLFNSVQTFLTGVLAAAGSIGLFYFASHLLNKYFRGAINDVDKICYLSWEELLVCGGAVVVLMLVASFAALPLLSKIEPSEGMRDV
jgi:putative ABC transport system permease protein